MSAVTLTHLTVEYAGKVWLPSMPCWDTSSTMDPPVARRSAKPAWAK